MTSESQNPTVIRAECSQACGHRAPIEPERLCHIARDGAWVSSDVLHDKDGAPGFLLAPEPLAALQGPALSGLLDLLQAGASRSSVGLGVDNMIRMSGFESLLRHPPNGAIDSQS
jgi:hypothetical protein